MSKVALALTTFVLLLLPTSGFAEPRESIIFDFHLKDGIGVPSSGLLLGPSGTLYGETKTGGGSNTCRNGCGTVFQLTPPSGKATSWTGTVLYAFTGGQDGSPVGGLVSGSDGSLYGVTSFGGISSCNCGTVFKLKPPVAGATQWTKQVLHSFNGGSDGFAPDTRLEMDAQGNLYGVTFSGGGANFGTVYKIAPPEEGQSQWTESIIYTFFSSVRHPLGPLTLSGQGQLYGLTSDSDTQRTLFTVNTAVGSKLYSSYVFDTSRYTPQPPVTIAARSTLIVTAFATNGICDQSAPPSTCGAVIALTGSAPMRTLDLLHIFGDPAAGASPNDGVVLGPKGILFGTTAAGGSGEASGHGTVFSLTPPATAGQAWIKLILHRFSGTPDGQTPEFGLTRDAEGALYGVTAVGGSIGRGVAFKIGP